ncbi:MAG: hypothetical protein KBC02_01115 [Candidatus Pacebacteria bacterium]|jgi:hypothetical protein|nr:hypothetical protein [Candidatus Paceibacterota bacterium]
MDKRQASITRFGEITDGQDLVGQVEQISLSQRHRLSIAHDGDNPAKLGLAPDYRYRAFGRPSILHHGKFHNLS